jgi:hypothetical protein
MSSSGTTTGTRESIVNGFSVIETFKYQWENTDPAAKYATIVYLSLVTLTYFMTSYNRGKSALLLARRSKKTSREELWPIVHKACTEKFFTDFFESVIFPYTIISKITPTIVFWLNRE